MRASRLISLLMLLQTHGQLKANELAERLEVSARTIYRDVDALSAAGVPIYAERGPSGGVTLMDRYRTSLTGLNQDEVRALFMLTVPGLLSDLGVDGADEQARLKLLASLPVQQQYDAQKVRQLILLDAAPWFQPPEPTPFLNLLQTACWEQRRIRMYYRRSDGKWIRRLVDPYGLVAKSSIWYLMAGFMHRTLTFRVSRIQEAEMTDSSFERPYSFDLAHVWAAHRQSLEDGLRTCQVDIAVREDGISLLVDAFGEGMHALIANAPRREDTRLQIRLKFADEEEASRRLLALAPAVEVIGPQSLRKRLSYQARKAWVVYVD